MRETAELILAQKELTWGMFKIGRVELCSYFRQRHLCHQVLWGQGYRNSLVKWELTKTCLLLLSASRLTRHRERQNTTWKLCFPHNTKSHPPLHRVICACGKSFWAPFCSENKGPSALYQQAWLHAFPQLWSSGTVLEHAQLVGTCRHSTAEPISHRPRVVQL